MHYANYGMCLTFFKRSSKSCFCKVGLMNERNEPLSFALPEKKSDISASLEKESHEILVIEVLQLNESDGCVNKAHMIYKKLCPLIESHCQCFTLLCFHTYLDCKLNPV